MVDNGEVVTTDPEVVRLFIDYDDKENKKIPAAQRELVTVQATKQSSYRRDNINYGRNELKLKVYEELSATVTASGSVLEAVSEGHIEVISQLSGMPDCSITLNERAGAVSAAGGFGGYSGTPSGNSGSSGGIQLDSVSFHHCVRLEHFLATRTA